MLKYYSVYIAIYRGTQKIATRFVGHKIAEDLQNHTDTLTWDNLPDYYMKNGIALPFDYWTSRKGIRISFFDFAIRKKATWDIRQWKYPELDLRVEWHYVPVDVSIETILKYHDAEKAIQYLNERKDKGVEK